MSFEVPADRAKQILNDLIEFREKLIHQLSRPEAFGNLEEQSCAGVLSKLSEVQGCITATRESLE